MTSNHAHRMPGLEHFRVHRRRAGLHSARDRTLVALWSAPVVRADEQVHLKIVGGLAGVSQY